LTVLQIAIQWLEAYFEDQVMPTTRPKKKTHRPSPLIVRLDQDSKKYLTKAADLRHISVSDYVREVTVAQARREVQAAQEQVIVLTPEEQLTFWKALHEARVLTPAQKRLGALMRGKK
jgi:uncharacterized protein (DUF1778 family)